jgi:ribosome-associated protein
VKIAVPTLKIDCKIRIMDFSEDLLREVTFSYIHSSGPGGQNVNKVATAVQLRFDALNSPTLDEGTRDRLLKIAGKRVTENGLILIEAKRYRSQEKNREDAQKRLLALVEKAQQIPVTRIPTRPSASSKQTRAEHKKRTSLKKQSRRTPPDWE